MKTYKAYRVAGEPVVTVINDNKHYELTATRSLQVENHSPTGFEWAYYGSGPAQLALAILLDYTNSVRIASSCYQRFKFQHIGPAPRSGFEIHGDAIDRWLTGLGGDIDQDSEDEEK